MNQPVTIIAWCLATAVTAMAGQPVNKQTRIFDPHVKSLKVALANNPYTPAIYTLGSDKALQVNFDYLDYDVHYLRYSVTHCNANWESSQLVASEYASGFNEADITDYAQSENTFVHYYNYNLTLPNEHLQLLKSGNYLLSVYEQDDPDKVLFQARFSVCEGTVTVKPQVTSRTDTDYNNAHQQVSFDLAYKQGTIADPYNELTCIVTQNSRDDNAVTVTAPMMADATHATYDHNRNLIFPAGNEFRRIETVSLHTLNMGVASIAYFEPYYHATLVTDQLRAESPYLYDQTQFGRFTIRNAESDYSATEAEYVVTHFSLYTGTPWSNGHIDLQGEFTEGLPAPDRTLHYDPNSGCYTCDLLLKQGAYNYQYLWVPDGTRAGQSGPIEGDKYQTVNEYLIKVYDRPCGERYDRLVGYGVVYSGL